MCGTKFYFSTIRKIYVTGIDPVRESRSDGLLANSIPILVLLMADRAQDHDHNPYEHCQDATLEHSS